MTRETWIWAVLFVAGGLFLVYRAGVREQGMGKVYVKSVRIAAAPEMAEPPDAAPAVPAAPEAIAFVEASPSEPRALFSLPRTIGLWIAAFLTLCVFSFLYRDNVFYKLAEAVMVGITAGYAMVTGFWDAIVGNLLVKLTPELMRQWALPGTPSSEQWDPTYLIPLALGLMLLMRLAPRGGWISRWPLAFIVGTTAGLKLIAYLDADFVNQIRNTIIPLVVMEAGRFQFWLSLRNVALVLSVLSCLTYFFFSVEHTGWVGRVSRVGIWVLMITFGASFAFTVMGRITLLSMRLEFLFDDWLWLIDPSEKR